MNRLSLEKRVNIDDSLIGRKVFLSKSLKATDITGQHNLVLHPGRTFYVAGFNKNDLLIEGTLEGDEPRQVIAVIKQRNKFTLLPDDRQRFVAARAIINKGVSILCCLRHKDRYNGGQWELPGGRCEGTETLQAALIRECDEEIGALVVPEDEVFQCFEYGKNFIIEHHFFKSSIVNGEPKPIDHEKVEFIEYSNLHQLKLAPSFSQWFQANNGLTNGNGR